MTDLTSLDGSRGPFPSWTGDLAGSSFIDPEDPAAVEIFINPGSVAVGGGRYVGVGSSAFGDGVGVTCTDSLKSAWGVGLDQALNPAVKSAVITMRMLMRINRFSLIIEGRRH